MSDIETAVVYSKKLESLLERKFAATGKGLHEKISSVEGQLSPAALNNLRKIATIRNKVVHEVGFEIPNIQDFVATCKAVLAELGEPVGTHTANWAALMAWVWLVGLTALAVVLHGFYVGHVGRGIGVGVGLILAGILMCSDEAIALYRRVGAVVLGLIVLSFVGYAAVTIWGWFSTAESPPTQGSSETRRK